MGGWSSVGLALRCLIVAILMNIQWAEGTFEGERKVVVRWIHREIRCGLFSNDPSLSLIWLEDFFSRWKQNFNHNSRFSPCDTFIENISSWSLIIIDWKADPQKWFSFNHSHRSQSFSARSASIGSSQLGYKITTIIKLFMCRGCMVQSDLNGLFQFSAENLGCKLFELILTQKRLKDDKLCFDTEKKLLKR